MPRSVTILVDHGECRSGLPEQLIRLRMDINVVHLDVGDVVIEGVAAVERKTVADLHRSIANRRLWRQVGALRADFQQRYLIIEGSCLWRGPIRPHGIRGVLLALSESGVTVVRAHDVSECAHWIRSISLRVQNAGAMPRGRQLRARSPYALLRAVPRLTPRAASGLLERFGSVHGVAAASDDELLQVVSVGCATVAVLREALS